MSASTERPAVDRAWGFRTRAIHAGAAPDPTTGARAVPIYQTTSFVFEDAADAADLFALQKYGSIYTRIGNPTVNAFEERMASLEGGIGAVATSSGQAAEFCTVACLADAGDRREVLAGTQFIRRLSQLFTPPPTPPLEGMGAGVSGEL